MGGCGPWDFSDYPSPLVLGFEDWACLFKKRNINDHGVWRTMVANLTKTLLFSGIAVSGSRDRTAIIWDLSRWNFVFGQV